MPWIRRGKVPPKITVIGGKGTDKKKKCGEINKLKIRPPGFSCSRN
jgi:hypothetical protein